MLLSTVGVVLQILGILTSALFDVSEGGSGLTLSPAQGSTFNISSRGVRGSKCTVCVGEGRRQSCSPAWRTLTGGSPASVDFPGCSRPQELFSLDVVRAIDCSSTSCRGDVDQTDAGSVPLQDFNRTFTWDLRAPGLRAVRLDFSHTGLRQIRPTESCPDRHTYVLWALQSNGPVSVGKFCRGGSITEVQILNQARLSLEVPARQKLQPGRFDVTVGEEIKSLAVVTVTLQEGASSAALFSPNYPDSFPDDDQAEWRFLLPPRHNGTVRFLGHAQPRCRKKEPAVEYESIGVGGGARGGGGATVLRLADPQPARRPDSFSLTLRNCEMDRTRTGDPGLSLHFQVNATRRSLPVLCDVDLRKEKLLSLHVQKTKAGSDCELRLNSAVQENVTAPPGRLSRLSFQDCSRQDLLLTAGATIECRQLTECPATPVPLAVPVLARCLPAPLQSITWRLRPPHEGTVELLPPAGGLRQTLSGRPCNGSVALGVAEDDGTSVGRFCPQGEFRKVQVGANVSVTASAAELRPSSQPLLSVAFSTEISERYIFTVQPKKNVPLQLATPSWPAGMKSYSTVSWIVAVPTKLEAHVAFLNVSQPKCSHRHTDVRVQTLGSPEEAYSRREDEKAGAEITVSQSFYLNMSNCMPERGAFRVLTHITLHQNKNRLLTIVLSVVAALLVAMTTVLAGVCLLFRRKRRKRQLSHQVSVYNNGTSFPPGRNGFPKSREDNESHVYASIEDTMVYGHLLRNAKEPGAVRGAPPPPEEEEVDVYRTFSGPTEAPRAGVAGAGVAGAGVAGAEVGVYQPFVPPSGQAPLVPDRPASHHAVLTDNELYRL